VEKRKPHYDLGTIRATFCTVQALRVTKTALTCAESLGFTLLNIVEIIQGTKHSHFYKSMTSTVSSAIWQDVYHVPHHEAVLYIKFTTDPQGYLIISFKEK
jgi:hypothetical protein